MGRKAKGLAPKGPRAPEDWLLIQGGSPAATPEGRIMETGSGTRALAGAREQERPLMCAPKKAEASVWLGVRV